MKSVLRLLSWELQDICLKDLIIQHFLNLVRFKGLSKLQFSMGQIIKICPGYHCNVTISYGNDSESISDDSLLARCAKDC